MIGCVTGGVDGLQLDIADFDPRPVRDEDVGSKSLIDEITT